MSSTSVSIIFSILSASTLPVFPLLNQTKKSQDNMTSYCLEVGLVS